MVFLLTANKLAIARGSFLLGAARSYEILRIIEKEQRLPERISTWKILCKPLFRYVRSGKPFGREQVRNIS